MTKNTVLPGNLVLTALSLAVMILLPIETVMAETQDADARISAIETRGDQVARQRQQVREEMNKANHFAEITAGWSERLTQAAAEVTALESQKQSGNINIYGNQQLDDQLQFARQKLENIRRLNGGQVIDGIPYRSIGELQEELKQKGREALQLNNDYFQLAEQLNDLDQERDRLVSQALVKEKSLLPWDKFSLKNHQEDLEILQTIVNNDRLWIIKGLIDVTSVPPHFSLELVISIITNDYFHQLRTIPGKKYDARELAAKIREFRDSSDEIKRMLRDTIIPETISEINELKRRIQRLEAGSPDIQGCWIVLVGSSNYPIITITANQLGDFEAFITKIGQLKFYRQGDRLFSVSRIDDKTYDGTEYSFTANGRPIKVALRLTVSSDGVLINYRSDAVLELRRCN
jgi:hypothetical protein